MDNVKRRVLKSFQLTNSDLEAIYLGKTVDDWLMQRVLDEYEGPDGWKVVEFEFINLYNIKCRGLIFTARVFFKICGPDDPYGRNGHVWESTLLGERNYPW